MTTRPSAAVLLATALLATTPVARLEAQLGGLIKKKVPQAAQVPSAGEAVTFDEATLELTPERIGQVIAAKATGRRMSAGPEGPNAIRQRLDALDARQAKIYETQAEAINAWDSARQDAERCRDSVLVVARDAMQMNTAEYVEKMRPLGLRMAQAQQRGDTAEIRKVTEEIRRAGEPTAADSARARQACPLPAPPPAVREWQSLNAEAERTRQALQRAEQAVRDAEEKASGMNHRQLGIACERILLYLARAKAKEQQKGFTSDELKALESAIEELQGACA